MQKVVIDTNVIVSSLIQRNYPYLIIRELFIGDKIELCLSEALMQEYCEVLRRPKFTIFYDFATRAEALLADIEAKAVMYIPKIKLNLISDDADNRILELADVSSATYIITGNTTDFTFPVYKRTRIVTPKEYWNNYEKNNLMNR